jgi:hypothetical protein
MAITSFFSKHAFKRIAQRTLLTYEEIGLILDGEFYVNTGTEPGFNRDHLVFYSHKDEVCFVAIRDHYSGKVITILPLDYHKNLAWPITESTIAKAQEIYPFSLLLKEAADQESSEENLFEQRIRLTFHYLDQDERRKSKPLLSVVSDKSWDELLQLVNDIGASALAYDKANSLNVPREKILGISARIGKRGSMQFFSLDELT